MKKRKFKRFFYVFISFIILLLGSISYAIISNKAPVIYGEVLYQLPYNKEQTLDLYLPTKSIYKNAPTLVFFHGGAWIAGRKESINFNRFNDAVNQLRDKGYTVISPNYALAENNRSPFPHCIQDAFDVIHWIEENADNYNLDTANVGVFGESAGANIALMTSFSSAEDFEATSSSIQIKYTIDVYGPTDLNSLFEMQHTDSLDLILSKLPSYLQSYMDISPMIFGFDPYENKNRATLFMQKYSPLNYVNGHVAPLLIIQGEKDQVVPPQQSYILKDRLDSLAIPNQLKIVKNTDHAFYGANEDQKMHIQEWIVAFVLDQYNNNAIK